MVGVVYANSTISSHWGVNWSSHLAGSCSLKDQRWFGSVVWFGDHAGDGGSLSDPFCLQEVVQMVGSVRSLIYIQGPTFVSLYPDRIHWCVMIIPYLAIFCKSVCSWPHCQVSLRMFHNWDWLAITFQQRVNSKLQIQGHQKNNLHVQYRINPINHHTIYFQMSSDPLPQNSISQPFCQGIFLIIL